MAAEHSTETSAFGFAGTGTVVTERFVTLADNLAPANLLGPCNKVEAFLCVAGNTVKQRAK